MKSSLYWWKDSVTKQIKFVPDCKDFTVARCQLSSSIQSLPLVSSFVSVCLSVTKHQAHGSHANVSLHMNMISIEYKLLKAPVNNAEKSFEWHVGCRLVRLCNPINHPYGALRPSSHRVESLENGSPRAGKWLQDSSLVVQGRNIATGPESSGSFLVRELESGGAAHGMCLVRKSD